MNSLDHERGAQDDRSTVISKSLLVSHGVLIQIDDNAMSMRVTIPAGANPSRQFIKQCHEQAGELGYGIKFVRG